MNTQDYINHINESIQKALAHSAWIDKEVLDIHGFSTGEQRRLISNLTHLPKKNPVYLEVGLYAGATFCAALNNNPELTAIGVEDFSQPFGESDIPAKLSQNVMNFDGSKHFEIIDRDFFKMESREMPDHIDIFYFDGEHSFESQAKALPHALDNLNDTFIFIVDDYAWEPVMEGTSRSIRSLCNDGKIVVHKEWHLTDGVPDGEKWHNDVAIFLCSKK